MRFFELLWFSALGKEGRGMVQVSPSCGASPAAQVNLDTELEGRPSDWFLALFIGKILDSKSKIGGEVIKPSTEHIQV